MLVRLGLTRTNTYLYFIVSETLQDLLQLISDLIKDGANITNIIYKAAGDLEVFRGLMSGIYQMGMFRAWRYSG